MLFSVNYHLLLFLSIVIFCSLKAYFAHKSVIFQPTGQSHVIVEKLEILTPQSIELLCSLTNNPSKPSNITGFWKKDGIEVENSSQIISRKNEQYFLQKKYVWNVFLVVYHIQPCSRIIINSFTAFTTVLGEWNSNLGFDDWWMFIVMYKFTNKCIYSVNVLDLLTSPSRI